MRGGVETRKGSDGDTGREDQLPGRPVFGLRITSSVALLKISLLTFTSAGPYTPARTEVSPCRKEAEPSGRDNKFCSQAKCRRLQPGPRGPCSVPESARIFDSVCIAPSIAPEPTCSRGLLLPPRSARLRTKCVLSTHAPTRGLQEGRQHVARRLLTIWARPLPPRKSGKAIGQKRRVGGPWPELVLP